MKAGVVTRRRDGVKILGVGELKTKATFEVEVASKSAAAAIEKAGGSLKTLRQEAAPSALLNADPGRMALARATTIC